MSDIKAAFFCRADLDNMAELLRQQHLLEKYAVSNDMGIVSAFLDESNGDLDFQNEVHFQMLCNAKQKMFDVLLVEKMAIFPRFNEDDIPKLHLHSVEDNITVTIGRSNSPFFEVKPQTPDKVWYYRREN